jgi:hypothetical protein
MEKDTPKNPEVKTPRKRKRKSGHKVNLTVPFNVASQKALQKFISQKVIEEIDNPASGIEVNTVGGVKCYDLEGILKLIGIGLAVETVK